MSFFRWTAPLFKLASHRWTPTDFGDLAGLLRPFVPPGGRLLDLGGGTGDLGAGIAAVLDAELIVADATGAMLARVDARPRVSVSKVLADRLPFPEAFFDGLLCSDAFHHFADQSAVASEMARVVRPGGGVLILELEPTGAMRIAALLERLLGEPAGFLRPHDLRALMDAHGINGHIARQKGVNYRFIGTRT
jgi:ubiquinone/menaquinone biosynthesis C-methylase UbiE